MAGGDVEQVDDRHVALAHVAEGARILQPDLIGPRSWQRSCLLGDVAISEFAPGRLVHQFVVNSLNLASVDIPALGGRLLQHPPGARAALTQRLYPMAHAARAVGVLVAILLLVALALDDAHALPIRIEFIGDDHRQCSARGSSSHLGAGGNNGHGAILSDRQEDMRVGADAVRHLLGAGWISKRRPDAKNLRREYETASCCNTLEYAAPAD